VYINIKPTISTLSLYTPKEKVIDARTDGFLQIPQHEIFLPLSSDEGLSLQRCSGASSGFADGIT
jgi:hypothetical protein